MWLMILIAVHVSDPKDVPAKMTLEFPDQMICEQSLRSMTYWVKFEWEMDSHHENQYVTEFNKLENVMCKTFQNLDEYMITVDFNVPEDYKTDEFSMIFGKPGKNMGLTYKKNEGTLAFEFWTKPDEGETDDKFNYCPFQMVEPTEVRDGVIITIIRDKNKFHLYKNFTLSNSIEFENGLIDDYNER